MTKEELRIKMKKKRNSLSIEKQIYQSSRIQEKFYDLEAFSQCGSLFTYVSFGGEADTKSVIEKAFSMHKKIFIPRVEGRDISFYRIKDMNSLCISKFGILEPDQSVNKATIPATISKEKKLMILPGLAFDISGNRVGFGAGYYDRYLSKYKDYFIKIAFAYDFQVVDEIKADEFDVKADIIITPERMIECAHSLASSY